MAKKHLDARYHKQPVVPPWPKGTLWDMDSSYKMQRQEKRTWMAREAKEPILDMADRVGKVDE